MNLNPWKKKPTRVSSEDIRVVTDLDRLVSESVGFRWNGKVHLIKPMSTEVFLFVLKDLARMDAIYKSKIRDEDTILRTYASLFQNVCDTISYDDVLKMSHAQITALFREIMDCVKGKAQSDESQKKTLQMSS